MSSRPLGPNTGSVAPAGRAWPCGRRTGDLLASGTISGPGAQERGSLIELTWNGAEPLRLADGTERTFLADGDEVVLRGIAGTGEDAVALGEVRGRIEP